jgi:hypothetical protein
LELSSLIGANSLFNAILRGKIYYFIHCPSNCFIIVSTLVDAILKGFSGIFYIREDAYSPPFNSTLFLLINSYSLSKTSYVLRQG